MRYKSIHQFYSSKKWVQTSKAYARSKSFLCERCLSKGKVIPYEEVHHKIRLSMENINNPDISLNWNNLECLCRKCHEQEHSEDARLRPFKRKDYQQKGKRPLKRYAVDQRTGKVLTVSETEKSL